MSADNGWVLRKDQRGRFVLQEYCASVDYPPINHYQANTFDTFASAMEWYAEIDQYSEYGLRIETGVVTPDPEPRLINMLTDSEIDFSDSGAYAKVYYAKHPEAPRGNGGWTPTGAYSECAIHGDKFVNGKCHKCETEIMARAATRAVLRKRIEDPFTSKADNA